MTRWDLLQGCKVGLISKNQHNMYSKAQNYMIISINIETASDKVQCPIMIRVYKLGTTGDFLMSFKEKLMDNIIVTGERFNAVQQISGTTYGCSLLPLCSTV